MSDPKKPLTVEELREKIEGIKRLLDDPHPGLMTWNEFLAKRMDELVKLWTGS